MKHLEAAFYKVVIAVLCVSILLTGCMMRLRKEPGKEETDAWFRENQADILLVTECLLQLDYDSCIVWDAEGAVKVYGKPVPIDNANFYPAVKRLFENGCRQIGREKDTIEFLLWIFHDGRGKGLAYSPNDKVPLVQFITEYELLEGEVDWYYYVSDYEKCRTEGRPDYIYGSTK